MIRNYKRVKWKKVVIGGLAGAAILFLTATIFVYRGWRSCLSEKKQLEERLNSYCHTVYVAAERLPKGSVLTEEKLNLEVRYYDLEHMNFITQESIGKTLAVDVEEETCITTEMLYTEQRNGRDLFISEVEFWTDMQTGDRIDVRIRYDNAEDYTVLTDKIIKKCDTGSGIVLELTEAEILLISSALADKKRYEGTVIYVAKYPDHRNVMQGTVNYIPNKEILALMGREKTEGESRTALEERLVQKK